MPRASTKNECTLAAGNEGMDTMESAAWLERFIKRLSAHQPAQLEDMIQACTEEWAPYWEKLNPEDAADMAVAAWNANFHQPLNRC